MMSADHPLAQFLTKITGIVIVMLAIMYPCDLGDNLGGKSIATGVECCSEAVNEPIYRHYHCVHASDGHMDGST